MMHQYGNEDNYEDTIKSEFKHGDLDLIIVVDKLLTGFDAPRAIVLYIDKDLREHNLLQAVARVNRLHDGKDYGYIIDYRGLLEQLDEAMDMYSGAGLDKFDPDDIKGALIDVKKVAKDLLNTYSNLKDFFGMIDNKTDMEAYEQYLEKRHLRDEFYEKLSLFSRNLKTVLGSVDASEYVGKERLNRYKERFKFYQNLRGAVKLRYSDSIDFKEYEDQMKNLIDTYVNADDIEEIVDPVNIMNIEAFEKELDKMPNKKAKADTIRTRISKSLQDIKLSDPSRYKKFSELLKEAYEEYRNKRLKEKEQLTIEEYYEKMQKIKEEYQKGREAKEYPNEIQDNKNAQVIYDLIEDFKEKIEENEMVEFNDYTFNIFKKKAAQEIDEVIMSNIKPEWHKNTDNINDIEIAIMDRISDFIENNNLTIEFEQIIKLSNQIVSTARERYKIE